MKHGLTRGLLLAGAMVMGFAASAQTFPSKAVRIVVPFGAGGVADLTARTVGQKLSESLGEAVAMAEPDGHNLLLMSNGTAVSAGMFKSLPFDAVKDFSPISTLGFFDIAIVTPAESRFKTLGELLAFAKANPGKLNLGTINIGSTQNLAAELFQTTSGVDMQIVPFNGTPAPSRRAYCERKWAAHFCCIQLECIGRAGQDAKRRHRQTEQGDRRRLELT